MLEVINNAILSAVSGLREKHPEVGVWLPEATYIQRGTVLDDEMWFAHYQKWLSLVASVAGGVNVTWVRSYRLSGDNVEQVCECYLSLSRLIVPTRVIGVRH